MYEHGKRPNFWSDSVSLMNRPDTTGKVLWKSPNDPTLVWEFIEWTYHHLVFGNSSFFAKSWNSCLSSLLSNHTKHPGLFPTSQSWILLTTEWTWTWIAFRIVHMALCDFVYPNCLSYYPNSPHLAVLLNCWRSWCFLLDQKSGVRFMCLTIPQKILY